jgi:hypothetical protein
MTCHHCILPLNECQMVTLQHPLCDSQLEDHHRIRRSTPRSWSDNYLKKTTRNKVLQQTRANYKQVRSEVQLNNCVTMLFFWVVTSCRLVGRYQRFGGGHTVFIFRADGGSMFLRNDSTQRQNPEERHPHRRENLKSHKFVWVTTHRFLVSGSTIHKNQLQKL